MSKVQHSACEYRFHTVSEGYVQLERLEEELRQQKIPDKVPLVANPESPSEEERGSHELTHANFKSWCKHCQRALAMRDKHISLDKSSTKHEYRYNIVIGAVVFETESAGLHGHE